MLVQQLPSPSHASGSTPVLLDLFNLGDNLNAVAKKDWRFKLPVGDADQCEGGNAGGLCAQSR
jgi:hypothetical protein